MSEPEGESVEVQVRAGGDQNSVFVIPTRSICENNINLVVKSAVENDDSTAQTEVSTEDENSLREKFSFGSISLTESAETSQCNGNKIDAPRPVWKVRPDKGNLFSIGEAIMPSEDQILEYQKNSLFDLDLSDDDIDITPGPKLTGENRVDSLYSESRAEFYRGYSLGTFVGDKSHMSERSASSRSMFPPDTLNTESRIGFYSVSSSAVEEPLSCREKLEQVC